MKRSEPYNVPMKLNGAVVQLVLHCSSDHAELLLLTVPT